MRIKCLIFLTSYAFETRLSNSNATCAALPRGSPASTLYSDERKMPDRCATVGQAPPHALRAVCPRPEARNGP